MTTPNAGSASVSIVPDLRGFNEELSAKLAPIGREVGDMVGREIGSAMRDAVSQDIDRIRLQLDELGAKNVNVDVDVDDHGSIAATRAKLATVGQAGSSALPGLSAMVSAIIAFGPAAVGAAAVAIPAIIAVGAAAAGAIAGLGVLALGFSGIGEALSASQKPSGGGSSGGGGGGGSGNSARIQQQQQALAAQQATQSAADQLTAALAREQDAEVTLAKAQRDAHDAQLALSAARKQAAQDLQDLTNKVTDNGLAQRDAVLKLDQAKKTLDLTKAAPGAGLPQYADQVAQAQLDYDKAKQNLSELQLAGTRLSDQKKTADKAGVDGAAGVVAAQNKLTDSHTALVKAQRDDTDAAHKLAEAQQNIIDTQTKNALAAQQAAAGLTAAAGGAHSFAAQMAKLNPLQQEFVNYILTLKPLFDELKLAASGFLPGLRAGIQAALPAFQPLLQVVGNIATALGDVFKSLGTALGSPEGRQFLGFLSTALPDQIRFLGRVALDFGKIFSGVFQQFEPLIKTIDTAVLGFLDSLAKTSTTGGFAGFIKEVTPLVGPVFSALASIGKLIGQIFTAIGPAIGPSLKLIQTLATVLGNIAGPVLTPLAVAFGDLVSALLPLIPLLGGIITAILPPLIKLLDTVIKGGIAPLADAIVRTLTPYLPALSQAFRGITDALGPLIPAIAQGLMQALQAIAPMIPQVVGAFLAMVDAFAQLLPQLLPLIPPLVALVSVVLTRQNLVIIIGLANALTYTLLALTPVIKAIKDFTEKVQGAINAAKRFGDAIFNSLSSAMRSVGGFFQALPGQIASLVGGATNWLSDTGRKVITGMLNGIANMVTGKGGLLSYFSGLPGTILGTLGDLGHLLYDVGGSIIDGLAAGIGDAIQGLGSVLGHVADFIPGWLKKILHINSPSKVLADQVGKWIPAGIAEGIDQNLGVVTKSMTNMLAGVSQFQPTVNTSAVKVGAQMSSPAFAGVAGGYGGQTVNNWAIPQQMDPQGVSHAVANRQALRSS